MELVLVTHRGGAALHVAELRAFVGDDERTFELSGARRIDAEITRQFHRALHAFRDIAERAVGKDGGVQRREIIIPGGDHCSQVFPDKVRVLPDGLREGAEYDALLGEGLAEGGLDGDGVEDCVYRDHSGKGLALMQRDAQLLESLGQSRIDLLWPLTVFLWGGVVYDILIVDFGQVEMAPAGLLHGLPLAECIQTELQEPFRLFLEGGYHADNVLVQALRDIDLLDVRDESFLVLLLRDVLQQFFLFH